MHHCIIRFPEGKNKLFTTSYDDGVDQDIRLVKLMEKYGIKGTFNINSQCFAEDGTVYPPDQILRRRMTVNQILDCYDSPNVEVAIHGAIHISPAFVPSSVAMCEFIDDRRTLEKMFGRMVRGAAYPYGTYNDDTVDVLRLAGVVYCRSTVPTGAFDIPKNWLRLDPTCHHNNEKLFELAEKFINETPKNLPYFFYVWGHSYEFDQHQNWNRIEDLFKKVSGKDDVWYCTNIEAYEYIEAFGRLVYSADGSHVYNPTLIDLWAWCDSKPVKIPSGKTVEL